jgi:hypothetical protein
MHGYGLSYVLYEVLDVHEFSDNDVDLSVLNIVMPEETAGEKNAAADIETELKELLSQTSQKKKKKDINEQQTRKTRFIPVGFSFMSGSDEQKRKGKAPTCRGCNNPILSGESKITHKHKQEPGHTYYSVLTSTIVMLDVLRPLVEGNLWRWFTECGAREKSMMLLTNLERQT